VVTLAEDLYLLASDGTSGRLLIDPFHLDLGIGGALLLDLARCERVVVADEHVGVVDATPSGEPLLDSALATIAHAGRSHDLDHSIRHLARGAHHAVQNRLVDVGVLRRDDGRVLGIIPVHHVHETDGRLHHELADHLRDAVVLGRPPTPETAALAALALSVRLDRHLFPRTDRRSVEERLGEVSAGCPGAAVVAAAVARKVAAVDAAMGLTPGFTT
jgi:Golgi phosphoprotein 3 (GPP34)